MQEEFPEYHSFMDGYRARMRRNRIIGLAGLLLAAAGAVGFWWLNF